jgi:hypothetical protein
MQLHRQPHRSMIDPTAVRRSIYICYCMIQISYTHTVYILYVALHGVMSSLGTVVAVARDMHVQTYTHLLSITQLAFFPLRTSVRISLPRQRNNKVPGSISTVQSHLLPHQQKPKYHLVEQAHRATPPPRAPTTKPKDTKQHPLLNITQRLPRRSKTPNLQTVYDR